MKITKTDYEALPASLKAAFTKIEGSEDYHNGEEDAAGLKAALKAEKEEKAGVKAKLDGFEVAKAKELEETRKKALADARNSGDIKAVEDDYKRQINELKAANEQAAKDVEERTKGEVVSKHVENIAKMFVSPALAKAFIKSRLTAELVDGQPIVRVLGKDGKASALSVEDLKKEYLTDGELKSSLVASRASGGGSGHAPTNGGTGVDNDKFDAAKASPKELVARLEAKGIGSEDLE